MFPFNALKLLAAIGCIVSLPGSRPLVSGAISLDLTLEQLAPYRDSPLLVPILSTVRLNCFDDISYVRNVNRTKYEHCLPPTTSFSNNDYMIGHCSHGVLSLNINSVSSPLVLGFEEGKTYYFVLYPNWAGTNATLCEEGFKFQLKVGDPSTMTTTQSITPTTTITSALISPSEDSTQSNLPIQSTTTTAISRMTTTADYTKPTDGTSKPTDVDKPTTSDASDTKTTDIDDLIDMHRTKLSTLKPTIDPFTLGISGGSSIVPSKILMCSSLVVTIVFLFVFRTILF